MKKIAALVILSMLALPPQVSAQSNDSLEVALVASTAFKQKLPRGVVVLLRRPLWSKQANQRIRSDSASRAIAAALGIHIVDDPSAHFVCANPGHPGPCRIQGADALVSIGRPQLDGDRASVRIVTQTPGTSRYFDVEEIEHLVTLRKIAGRWRVTGVAAVSGS